MQINRGLTFLVAVLFLISGVFHLTVGYSLLATEFAPSIIDLVFGIIYIVLGISVFVDKRRLIFYLCLIFAFIDGAGGLYAHIASQAIAPLIAALIDLVIILICAYLVITKKATVELTNSSTSIIQ